MKPKTARSKANSDLLSSSSAAKLAGVTPSTIKRWADEGRLQCERTAGGHRRFRKSILMRFLRGNSNTEQVNDEVQKWVMTLVSGSHYSAVSELYRLRQEMGCWAKTATALEPVIEEIGNAWANDRITVAQEHRASECLARAIWQVGNAMPSCRDDALPHG